MSPPSRLERPYALALGTALLLLAWRAVASVLSAEGLYWDFTNFYNTGARVFNGEIGNLYRRDSLIAGEPRELTGIFEYLGIPISAYIWAPLGAFSPRTALYVFKAFCLLCYAGAFSLLYRWLQRALADKAPAGIPLLPFLVLILLCEPAWRIFRVGGQSTALAFLLVVATVYFVHGNRQWAAAIALSVATLIKPIFVVSPLVFLAGGMVPFVIRFGTCLVAEAGLSVAAVGLPLHYEWLETMGARGGLWAPEGWVNSSIHIFFLRILVFLRPELGTVEMPAALAALVWALRIAIAATLCFLALRIFGSDMGTRERRLWVTFYAIFFGVAFPVRIWEHYLLFLLPALCYLAFGWRRLTRPAFLLTLGALLGMLRAAEFFADGRFLEYVTANSLGEIVVLGALGSATMMLTLAVWLTVDPVKLETGPAVVSSPRRGSISPAAS